MKKILLFLGVILSVFGAFSQDTDATTPADTVVQPKAIDLTQVSVRTTQIKREIEEYKAKTSNVSVFSEVDSTYTLLHEELEKEYESNLEFKKSTPNKNQLDNSIKKWKGFLVQLDRMFNKLDAEIIDLSKTLDKINFKSESWSLTYTKAREEGAPPEILENIRNVRSDIKKVKSVISKQNNKALSLGNTISEEILNVNNIIADLEKMTTAGELNVLFRTYPAIWVKDTVPNESDLTTKDYLKSNLDSIGAYNENYSHKLWSFVLIIIGVFILMFYLRRLFKKTNVEALENRQNRTKLMVSRHTTATSFYLIFLIALLTFDNLPVIMYQWLISGITISVIFLLGDKEQRKIRKLMFLIFLAFAIDGLKSYVWLDGMNYRLFLYAEIIYNSGVLWYFYKQQHSTFGSNPLPKWVMWLVPLFTILQVVAFVSNTLGYTNLTDLMLKVSTQGTIITVVSYGIWVIVGGLSISLINAYFNTKVQYDALLKHSIEHRVEAVVKFLAVLFWMVFLLSSADLYYTVSDWLGEWLDQPWGTDEFSISPRNLLSFIGIVLFTYIITKLISALITGGALDFLKLPKGVPNAISMVVRYFVVAIAFMFGLGALGIDLKSFSLLAGALGLGIGFGLQNIISNFVAGVILTFERPFKIGDIVEVGTLKGKVKSIGVRSSSVRTFDGSEVVIPNNNLLSNEMINWTLSDEVKRVEILIGVEYGADPNEVLEILVNAAKSNELALKDPEPSALFQAFGDSSLNFRLLVWSPIDEAMKVKSEVSIAVYNALSKANIGIPFPQREIKIINANQMEKTIAKGLDIIAEEEEEEHSEESEVHDIPDSPLEEDKGAESSSATDGEEDDSDGKG